MYTITFLYIFIRMAFILCGANQGCIAMARAFRAELAAIRKRYYQTSAQDPSTPSGGRASWRGEVRRLRLTSGCPPKNLFLA